MHEAGESDYCEGSARAQGRVLHARTHTCWCPFTIIKNSAAPGTNCTIYNYSPWITATYSRGSTLAMSASLTNCFTPLSNLILVISRFTSTDLWLYAITIYTTTRTNRSTFTITGLFVAIFTFANIRSKAVCILMTGAPAHRFTSTFWRKPTWLTGTHTSSTDTTKTIPFAFSLRMSFTAICRWIFLIPVTAIQNGYVAIVTVGVIPLLKWRKLSMIDYIFYLPAHYQNLRRQSHKADLESRII